MSKGVKIGLWVCAIAAAVGLCYLVKNGGDKAVTTTDITLISNTVA